MWCVICENQLRIAFINKLNVRQPQNLILFQLGRAAASVSGYCGLIT